MDRTRLAFGSLFVFLLGAVPAGAFGQAAAEAGLLNGLSSISTSSAASNLGAATNRALQGHKVTGGTVSRPVTTTVVHKTQPFGAKASPVKTTSGHSGVVTVTDHGAKLPSGVAHVWPPDALTPAPQ
jgi:type IV secretory pathway TrbL component